MALKTARGRSEAGLFMIEDVRSVRDAILKGAKLYCVIEKDGVKTDIEYNCPVYTFAPKLFDNISETVTPQGVIAVVYMHNYTLGDVLRMDRDCVILCEALQDPGNIGTVIRTAHAAALGGVILTKGCCDLYNPKIVRSTMTGMMSIPVVQNVTAKEAVELFRKNGYGIVAGALTDTTENLYETSLSGKQLIIIGNEGNGVTEDTLKMCDKTVKIPMEEDAESLNAAIAGAVMIYEHYRQNIKKL
jgi:TrmH family RNA methyltransferase